jgi:phage terminase small subunit
MTFIGSLENIKRPDVKKIMNGQQVTMWKVEVMSYLKVLAGETEENHELRTFRELPSWVPK